MLGRWTEVYDEVDLIMSMRCARGVYQRDLLKGHESLSGSTLVGTARSYGYWYARSRQNLLARMRRAGVHFTERKGAHNARILVLGLQRAA